MTRLRNCVRAAAALALVLVAATATAGAASAAPAATPSGAGANLLATKTTSIQPAPDASIAGIQCFVATLLPQRSGSQIRGFSSVTCSSAVRLIEIRTVLINSSGAIVADTGIVPTMNTNRVENTATGACRTDLYRTAAAVFVEFGSGEPPTASGVFASDWAAITC